jgi:hypothetical protein
MSHTAASTEILDEIIAPGPAPLAHAVKRFGDQRCGDALVDELISRCDPPHIDTPVDLHLAVTAPEQGLDYHIRFTDEAIEVDRGEPESPWARFELTLAGLADLLFGDPPVAAAADWEHVGLNKPTPEKPPQEQRSMRDCMRANHALLAALTGRAPSLESLAGLHDTDKWGLVHWYTPHYEQHFRPFADRPARVLEIGIGGYADPESGGGSLRMWQRFFRRGTIYGLDIYEKRLNIPRVHTVRGDQGDPDFMSALGERIGPLDIVVDDGSHLPEHVLTSFRALFPHLSDGGIYVIEDLEPSYWPGWGGRPPGSADASTGIGFLKTLIDGLNHREFDGGEPGYIDRNVRALHFYHNIAFVVKGPNRETGAPEIVRDMPPAWFPEVSGGNA